MPWQNNGSNGGGQNPWGNNNGPRGGGEPPQIDEIIRKSQDHIKQALPGGMGGFSLILLVLVGLWLASGIYFVEPNEQAVVQRFGKWTESTGPGAHYHLPFPIESRQIRGVTDENQIEVGVSGPIVQRSQLRSNRGLSESRMLTGDENIVEVKFNLVWRIQDLGAFLFNLKDQEQTIKAVAESVMRELVGQEAISSIITSERASLQTQARTLVQQSLDDYDSGVEILRVQISAAEAPEEVKDSFLDVQRAEAEKQQKINDADRYRKSVVPRADGEAKRLVNDAEAYKARVVAEATGESARFLSVYNEYAKAKDVTRKRIYLETMEEILAGMDKTVIDSGVGSGVVPYLPLDQLNKKPASQQSGGQ